MREEVDEDSRVEKERNTTHVCVLCVCGLFERGVLMKMLREGWDWVRFC